MLDRETATKCIRELLQLMMDSRSSDLFVTTEFPPAIKVDGKVTPISQQPSNTQQALGLAKSIMNEKQLREYEDSSEYNFAITAPSAGRFHMPTLMQQGHAGMALQTINTKIPTLDELNLPPTLSEIVMSKRGLVIIVGTTNSDKSTSLTAIVGYRNTNSYGHIIAIKGPVEYVHTRQSCVVTQREVDADTRSWHVALKNALRQASDVILIGEIRDRDTMEYAIQYAETGHLYLATLHANGSDQVVDRIINFFPEEKRQQLLIDLSLNLRMMIVQHLLPRQDKKGRIPTIGAMLATPLVQDLIFRGKMHELEEVMKKSREQGMISFDQALFDLYEENRITHEDALRNADSLNDLRLQVKLYNKRGGQTDLSAGTEHLNVVWCGTGTTSFEVVCGVPGLLGLAGYRLQQPPGE